jgi:hypothetical protein
VGETVNSQWEAEREDLPEDGCPVLQWTHFNRCYGGGYSWWLARLCHSAVMCSWCAADANCERPAPADSLALYLTFSVHTLLLLLLCRCCQVREAPPG